MRMGLPWRSPGSRGAHRHGVWEGQDGYPNRRVVPLCQWATADSPLHLALASELVAALKQIPGYPLPPNPLDLASVLGGRSPLRRIRASPHFGRCTARADDSEALYASVRSTNHDGNETALVLDSNGWFSDCPPRGFGGAFFARRPHAGGGTDPGTTHPMVARGQVRHVHPPARGRPA